MGDEKSKRQKNILLRLFGRLADCFENGDPLPEEERLLLVNITKAGSTEREQSYGLSDFVYNGLNLLIDKENGPNNETRKMRFAQNSISNRAMTKKDYMKWHHKIRDYRFSHKDETIHLR